MYTEFDDSIYHYEVILARNFIFIYCCKDEIK